MYFFYHKNKKKQSQTKPEILGNTKFLQILVNREAKKECERWDSSVNVETNIQGVPLALWFDFPNTQEIYFASRPTNLPFDA